MRKDPEEHSGSHDPPRAASLPEDSYAHRIFNATWRIARAIDIGSRKLEAQHQERRRGRRDRRVVYVSATDAGRALAAKAAHPLLDEFAKALEQLSKQDQEDTTICIERLVDLLWPRANLAQGRILRSSGAAQRNRPQSSQLM